MSVQEKFFVSLVVMFVVPVVSAATVRGRVKAPDGSPFMGAFVTAENHQNKISISVLSDRQGRYTISDLTAATYTFRIRAIGYKADPHGPITIQTNTVASIDFELRAGTVRWADLSTYQGRMLLPKTDRHDLAKGYDDDFFTTCLTSCHSFQTRMAPVTRDLDGWRDRVNYMRTTIFREEEGGPRVNDERADDIARFLTAMFGPDSSKPPSPSDLPQYKATVRSFSEKAMNIVYVEYNFEGSRGLGPWSASPDKDGNVWIPYYGRGNQVVRLNPKTGAMTHFALGTEETAGIHSAIAGPDGSVWFSEVNFGALGHLDPTTKSIVEYRDTTADGKPIGKHTLRIDSDGNVWSSGGPISKFDVKAKTFLHFDIPGTYGNEIGSNGDKWFTVFRNNGPIVRISSNGKVTKFTPSTRGKPQRLKIDSDGTVWFTERVGNKIGRLDPETGVIKEFELPGPAASPYAIGIDRDHFIWYSSHEQDTLGRLDPNTGEVVEYPFPHSEISMRELFMDHFGHLWFASSSNDRVGYFYFDNEKK